MSAWPEPALGPGPPDNGSSRCWWPAPISIVGRCPSRGLGVFTARPIAGGCGDRRRRGRHAVGPRLPLAEALAQGWDRRTTCSRSATTCSCRRAAASTTCSTTPASPAAAGGDRGAGRGSSRSATSTPARRSPTTIPATSWSPASGWPAPAARPLPRPDRAVPRAAARAAGPLPPLGVVSPAVAAHRPDGTRRLRAALAWLPRRPALSRPFGSR